MYVSQGASLTFVEVPVDDTFDSSRTTELADLNSDGWRLLGLFFRCLQSSPVALPFLGFIDIVAGSRQTNQLFWFQNNGAKAFLWFLADC